MTSPLYPYINSRVLFPGVAMISNVNGRFEETTTESYLVKAWMKRIQYSGVTSGSKKLPMESQLGGQMLPGAAGDQFYYRGYALEYANVPTDYSLEAADETGLVFQEVLTQYPWLKTGQEVPFLFGQDPILISKVQRSSGIFGGVGIDEIIYSEIGGVQLQLTGGEVQN